MTTEVLTQSLTAGGAPAVFGQGTMFYLRSAESPIDIAALTVGSSASVRNFNGVPAGFKFTSKKGDGFSSLSITSSVDQSIEIAVGDDDVEFGNAVSVVGTVAVVESASAGFTASVADTIVANNAAVSIAANPARSRITLGALSANTGSLRVQSTGAGPNKGLELQAGTFVQFETLAALDVRNDSGASQTFWVFEEL